MIVDPCHPNYTVKEEEILIKFVPSLTTGIVEEEINEHFFPGSWTKFLPFFVKLKHII